MTYASATFSQISRALARMQRHSPMVGGSALQRNGTVGLRLRVGVTGPTGDEYGAGRGGGGLRPFTPGGTLPIWLPALLYHLAGSHHAGNRARAPRSVYGYAAFTTGLPSM